MIHDAPWQDSGTIFALPTGQPAVQRQSLGGRVFATRVMEEEPAVDDVLAGMDYLMQLHIEHNQCERCIMVRLVVAIVEYWNFAQCTDSVDWRSAVEMALAGLDFDFGLVRGCSV